MRFAQQMKGALAEGEPKAMHWVCADGGSGRSTVDGGEGNEPAGGKAPTGEDLGRAGAGPDTGPG
jgi:hypothetical protein